MHARLDPALHHEDAASLRRAAPLVHVRRVCVGADRIDVEIDRARCVRAVDDGEDPLLPRDSHDFLDRNDKRRRTRDVIDEDEARSVVERADDRIDPVARSSHRHRDDDLAKHDAELVRKPPHRLPHRAVDMVDHHDLVAPLPRERAQHGVDRLGRVRHKAKSIGSRADETSDARRRIAKKRRQLAPEQLDRTRLDLVAKAPLRGKHFVRAGAEASVVQEAVRPVEGKRLGPDPEIRHWRTFGPDRVTRGGGMGCRLRSIHDLKVLGRRDFGSNVDQPRRMRGQTPCGRVSFGRTSTEQNLERSRAACRSQKHDRTDPQHDHRKGKHRRSARGRLDRRDGCARDGMGRLGSDSFGHGCVAWRCRRR